MKRFKINKRLIILVLIIITSSLILIVACATTSTGGSTSTSSRAPASTSSLEASGGIVTIDLVAQNMAFDKSIITVPVGAQVTINFNNKDSGVPHNLAVYNDQSASQTIFKGEVFNGPATRVYTFTAPSKAGNYFFRCDVHPTTMTGTFIVQ